MKTKIFIALFALCATLISCKKTTKGDMGPAGPAGTNGTNGNANVKAYYFGKDSIMATRNNLYFFLPSSVTANMIDSSIVLVYHKTNGLWYSSPGFGYGADYQIRIYTDSNVGVNFVALNPDGTPYSGAKYILTQIKVILVPSSDYSGFRKKFVNFNDYYATMKYFDLSVE